MMQFFLWFALAAGHIGLWCAIFNRTHATACPRGWRKIIEKMIILLTGLPLLLVPLLAVWSGSWVVFELAVRSLWGTLYALVCVAAFSWFAATWLNRIGSYRRPEEIRLVKTTSTRPEAVCGQKLTEGSTAALLRMIPGNQVVRLDVEEYRIDLRRGATGADPVRIAQLSDLHFTGIVKRRFFEHAAGLVRDFSPHLVFVTGDIVDEVECLGWLDPVFRPLTEQAACFYILGNHDRRIRDTALLRKLLARCGMVQASGRWHALTLGGANLAISGNELPWYPDAAHLPPRNDGDRKTATQILLAHSPDQIHWAAGRGIDLVFAGHTHGGQIRLPVVGPIIAPSRHGVRFASGDHRIGNTLMHVSRGLSGDDPIRLRCPPELGLFEVLFPDAGASSE